MNAMARARSADAWFTTAAVVAGWVASTAMTQAARQFPLEDATNNLARYVLLDRAWLGSASGPLPAYISIRPVIGPYLGFDAVGATLVHFFGPVAALHIIAGLVVSAIPVGMWLLLGATGRAHRAWTLTGVLLGMGFFTVVGFINYTIGIGAALIWLAAWWRWRAAPSGVQMAALWIGVLALYLLHLSAPLLVLVVVWIDTFLALSTRPSGASAPDTLSAPRGAGVWWRRVPGRRLSLAAGATLVLALACLYGGIGTGAPTLHERLLTYPPLLHKLVNVLTPFYVFSRPQTVASVAIYTMMAAAFAYVNRDALVRRGTRSTFVVSPLAFLVLYFLFPAGTPGTGYLDMRWLLPVFLLPFAMAEAEGRAPPRAVVLLLLAGCLVQDVVLWRGIRPIEQELGDYRAVLAQVPAGTRLLPLVADRDRYGMRVFPYRHFAFWHVIQRNGRVPGLFNGGGEGNGRPAHAFLRHFVERDHLYEPGDAWGTSDFSPLDWTQIDAQYDYVIQAGTDPRATRQVAGHATLVTRVGDITLFRVVRKGIKRDG